MAKEEQARGIEKLITFPIDGEINHLNDLLLSDHFEPPMQALTSSVRL